MTRPGERPGERGGGQRPPVERLTDLANQIQAIKNELSRAVGAVAGEVQILGGDFHDLRDAFSSDFGPKVYEHEKDIKSLNEDLDQLQLAVKALVQKDRKTKNPPIDWAALSAKQAEKEWDKLSYWVDAILPRYYEITRAQLPDCWPLHWPAVNQLSWLRTLRIEAYGSSTHPVQAAEWNTRWLDAALDKIRQAIPNSRCWPRQEKVGMHLVDRLEAQHQAERAEAAAKAGAGGSGGPASVPAGPKDGPSPYSSAAAARTAANAARVAAQGSVPGGWRSGQSDGPEPEDGEMKVAGSEITRWKWWGGYFEYAKATDLAWRHELESRHTVEGGDQTGEQAAADDDGNDGTKT